MLSPSQRCDVGDLSLHPVPPSQKLLLARTAVPRQARLLPTFSQLISVALWTSDWPGLEIDLVWASR